MRPQPRKSTLAGITPLTPQPAPAEANRLSDHLGTPPEPRPTLKPPLKHRHKVSFYQNPASTDRVRAALLHTMAREGARSLSQFIDDAVMAQVEQLEAKYNAGKPWPPVAARELPQGRPMGE